MLCDNHQIGGNQVVVFGDRSHGIAGQLPRFSRLAIGALARQCGSHQSQS